MTVKLNFDKIHQQRLLQLLEWLKGIGVVKSYEVDKNHSFIKEPLDGEELLDDMLQQAEKDILAGNLLTSEEVTTRIENWLKENK